MIYDHFSEMVARKLVNLNWRDFWI